MTNSKLLRSFLLGGVMLACFAAGAAASEGIKRVDAYLRPDFNVKLDGRLVELDQPILIYNDRSYMPLLAVSKLVGADIRWQEETKTIFINSRIQPVPEAAGDLAMTEMELLTPAGFLVHYLGGKFPLLTNTAMDRVRYYRESDLHRMGLETAGLRKAKEKLTGEIYIPAAEVESLWLAPITLEPVYEPIVTGETDPDKIRVLKDVMFATYVNGIPYPVFVYMYAIDKIPDKNEYEYLVMQDGKYWKYRVSLAQRNDETWYVSQYSSIAIDHRTP